MLKSLAFFTALTVLFISASASAMPGNTGEGKKVHEANCLSCHNDSVYKRKDRIVRSFDALTGQVNNCGHAVDAKLGKAQIDDLVKYLNETYYKFK